MNRYWKFLFAAIWFAAGDCAVADAFPAIPAAAMPTVKCIYRVLKSANTVQSVSLYDIDGFRFAAEYVFRNKNNQAVVSDIELLTDPDGSVAETDKVPREVLEDAANEGQHLESKLDLYSKCHLTSVLDNLLPEPKARADWKRIDWPKE